MYISVNFGSHPKFKLLLHLQSGAAYKADLAKKMRYSVVCCGEARRGLARVVRKVDNAIHRINHYPVDSVVCLVKTYPLDSDLSGG